MIKKIQGVEFIIDMALETLDQKFLRFVNDHLSKFDVSKLGTITMTTTNSRNDWWKGSCRYATKYRPAAILIATNNRWTYPLNKAVHIGTEKINQDQDWRYVFKDFIFNSHEEAMLKVYGHEIFHFLKKTKQLTTKEWGRNGNPAANRYGMHLITEYQNFK